MAFGQPAGAPAADPWAGYRAGFVNVPQGPMAQAVAKPKVNWLGVLADALSGAAGQTPLYTQSLLMQRKQAQEQAQQQAESDRELSRQKALFDYEQANRPPQQSETERLMARYLDPNTPPDEKALIGQQLIKPQAVTVTNPDGSQELRFIYPGQQQQPKVFKQLPPGAVPLSDGGPASQAPGNFPR
jgi:hypothetical protein